MGFAAGRTPEVDRRIDAAGGGGVGRPDRHERWPEWGPSIRDVECADRRIRTGSRDRVHTVGGLELPFEVTACEEYRWTWWIARIPATGYRVEPSAAGCCCVFELPLLAAGYTPVCRIALSRIAALVG